jgi:hypothetical protein
MRRMRTTRGHYFHPRSVLNDNSSYLIQNEEQKFNAIVKTRLEYEERLSQQLFSCIKKCEDTKAEAIVIVGMQGKEIS